MRRELTVADLPKLTRVKGLTSRSFVRGPRPRDVVRRVMQANRPTGSRPEVAVRRILDWAGIPFTCHVARLPGNPDFVIERSKVAIFVDGDFWHGYRFGRWKAQLSDYWVAKIERNRARDRRTFSTLRRRGWKVVRVWEHELANVARVRGRILTSLIREPGRSRTPKRQRGEGRRMTGNV
jgi:DNA mismatch endonuclease, patch repair protein